MPINTTITFTTTPSHSQFLGTNERYIGQLKHNRVFSKEGTIAAYAKYRGFSENEAETEIHSLCAFMMEELANGNHLDLGSFTASLKLTGGFDAANAPFDPARQQLTVVLTPGKKLKAAAQSLQPVNAMPDGGMRITATCQTEPVEAIEAISTTGDRILTTTGTALTSETDGTVESISVEDDAGNRLLQAEILAASPALLKYRLTGPIPAGLYWLVIAKREHGTRNATRRRLKAV